MSHLSLNFTIINFKLLGNLTLRLRFNNLLILRFNNLLILRFNNEKLSRENPNPKEVAELLNSDLIQKE